VLNQGNAAGNAGWFQRRAIHAEFEYLLSPVQKAFHEAGRER
jgi:hypothetical protein